jgi:hypothetical protein
MRGGAIPVLIWGGLIAVLLTINGIWTDDRIQILMFGFAVAVLWAAVVGLWLSHRQALRRGPPALRSVPEAVPANSLAALGLGLSTAAMLFSVVFGKFILFIGAGVWVVCAGRLWVEVRAQRRSVEAERDRW